MTHDHSGIGIGSRIFGADPNGILFANDRARLKTDPLLTWDEDHNRLRIQGGTVANDNSTNILQISGTLPANPSAGNIAGVLFTIAGDGSASQNHSAMRIKLTPGYTGGNTSIAFEVENESASTGYGPHSGDGNVGVYTGAFGTTVGGNIGSYSWAANSAANMGVVGWAAEPKDNGTNVGGVFFGRNTGVGSTELGIYVGLQSESPNFTSGAVVADNGSTTHPIALFRNNGVTQVAIEDGVAADNSTHLFKVTGTLPAVPSSSIFPEAITFDVTSAGSSTLAGPIAFSTYLKQGYTGTFNTYAGYFLNEAQSTNTLAVSGANVGFAGGAAGDGNVQNTGINGWAADGTQNFGVAAQATGTNGPTIKNVGLFGLARNTDASGVEVAGHFSLATTVPVSLVSAALVADNGLTTSPIARFRNAGVDQVKIGDGVPNDNSQHFLEVTGTLPSTPSGLATGVLMNITSAGSPAQPQIGAEINLLAGYTGSQYTVGVNAINGAQGTEVPFGNVAVYGESSGTTVGTKTGVYGHGRDGNISVGVFGDAIVAKNNATNVGLYGIGRNTGTTPTQIGVYAGLNADFPTFTSAALIADNSDQTSPIALFRNNGVNQVSIGDGVANDNSQNFLKVIGTLPATPSTGVDGILFDITPAGSAAQSFGAFTLRLRPGYTGPNFAAACVVASETQGTATDIYSSNANFGIYSECLGSGAGAKVAVFGFGYGGSGTNIGGWFGGGQVGAATAVGLVGLGVEATNKTGVYAGLNTSTPTFESAALIADNSAQALPIFLARDNGTVVHSVQDGGSVQGKMGSKTLTETVATGFVRIAVAQGTTVAGVLKYSIEALDATDLQARTGIIPFSAYNKAGTEVGAFSTPDAGNETVAASAGTLSNTFTMVSNAVDTIDFMANATSSLTQTTLRIHYTVELFGNVIVAVTPL